MTICQCVPNFSEGRRPSVVAAIAEAIRQTPGALLIDSSADVDHNRCVMTILGDAEALRTAVLAAARVAVACIDMRTHTGAHPRIGAIDVVPVIPLPGARIRGERSARAETLTAGPAEEGVANRKSKIENRKSKMTLTAGPAEEGITPAVRGDAILLAMALGADLADHLAIPVYFYEWAAQPGRPSALPDLRRGGFEMLARTNLRGDRAPDLGPAEAHPTAGVALVGARGPLVAYNINLGTEDVRVARAIAHRIRQARDWLPALDGVRALGISLTSQGRAQVSMNLTRPGRTPLPGIFAFVREEAAQSGVEELESEVIGAIPEAALGGLRPEDIRWHAYRPAQILETWLAYPARARS
jgi:glutamate formiminotransferase